MREKKGLEEWISLEDIEVEAHLRRRERKSLGGEKRRVGGGEGGKE